MLQYEKVDISEGIDANKASASKQCELCHYWFFKDVGFKFEKHVCNGCHDLLTMAYSLEDIAILSAKGAILGVFCWVLVKMRRLNSSVLEDKGVS